MYGNTIGLGPRVIRIWRRYTISWASANFPNMQRHTTTGRGAPGVFRCMSDSLPMLVEGYTPTCVLLVRAQNPLAVFIYMGSPDVATLRAPLPGSEARMETGRCRQREALQMVLPRRFLRGGLAGTVCGDVSRVRTLAAARGWTMVVST